MDLQTGSSVGDYQVVDVLGAGGMGKVYKVRNVISDRIEAMKVLLPDLANAPELADRFMREIKVQASLVHPNIASLYTALRVDNQLLMLMEFVEGVTLEQKLREGPLPVSDAVAYMQQVLSALEFAHGRGVIHRDIKPANMMLTTSGSIKLMDFGIAKASADHRLTMTGTTLGSLYYMSPEQIQGAANLDGRADLYSAGISLYELVTGRRPFDGTSQFEIMSAHLNRMPAPPIELDPKLPQLLNDVILMAVAKSPDARFQTAGAFRNALGNVLASPAKAAPAAVAAAAVATGPPKSRRGLWMGVGAVAMAAAVIALVQFGPWHGSKAAPSPTQTKPAEVVTTPPPQPAPAPVPVEAAPTPLAVGQGSDLPQRATGQVGTLSHVDHAPASAKPIRAQAIPAQPVTPAPQSQPAAQQVAAPPPAQPAPPPAQPAPTPPPPNRAELQETREQLVMLNVRAGGIRTSLQTLQRSQAASGLNLRGDMQEAAGLMDSYLQGANAALNAGDAASAKSFMEKAERQVERLEKFLNR